MTGRAWSGACGQRPPDPLTSSGIGEDARVGLGSTGAFSDGGKALPVVSIALEEGFEGDAVEVQVGARVERRADVRTRTVIGLAELVELQVQPGRWDVQVRLPERSLSTELPISVDIDDVNVRVWLTGDRLEAEVVDAHRYA